MINHLILDELMDIDEAEDRVEATMDVVIYNVAVLA
jgi:hypothetical protein